MAPGVPCALFDGEIALVHSECRNFLLCLREVSRSLLELGTALVNASFRPPCEDLPGVSKTRHETPLSLEFSRIPVCGWVVILSGLSWAVLASSN